MSIVQFLLFYIQNFIFLFSFIISLSFHYLNIFLPASHFSLSLLRISFCVDPPILSLAPPTRFPMFSFSHFLFISNISVKHSLAYVSSFLYISFSPNSICPTSPFPNKLLRRTKDVLYFDLFQYNFTLSHL